MARPNSFDGMMHDYCVRLGWCGGATHVTDLIPEHGLVTADQFVEWLILADGYDVTALHSAKNRWGKELKAVFVKHMGTEVIAAEKLKSDY